MQDRARSTLPVGLQLYVGHSDLLQLLTRAQPDQLRLLRVEAKPIGFHPNVDVGHTSCQLTDSNVSIGRQQVTVDRHPHRSGLLLRVLRQCRKARPHTTETAAEYGALWYTPQQADKPQTATSVRHTLSAVDKEGANPVNDTSRQPNSALQPHQRGRRSPGLWYGISMRDSTYLCHS